MKQVLLSLILIASISASFAQGCDEIFISEYIEGWSNNKAIELYNPTNESVDLSNYRLERYSNGSTSADLNQRLDLEGTMPPLSVWVIVIDKRDPDGTGQEAPVWDELQEKADIFMCPVYADNNAMYYNGNDALVLRNNGVVVDTFGKIGQDPGNPSDGGGWNNVPPAFTWGDNLATAWSADHTLIRHSNITTGDVNPTDDYDVSAQWDSLPANTFENLGSHMCDCGSVIAGIEENKTPEFSLFPNPSDNGLVQINSDAIIRRVNVIGIDGRMIREEFINGFNANINLSELPGGTYIVQITDNNNRVSRKPLIIK